LPLFWKKEVRTRKLHDASGLIEVLGGNITSSSNGAAGLTLVSPKDKIRGFRQKSRRQGSYPKRLLEDGTFMKTYSAKDSEVVRKWLVVDAKDKVLGRISTEIARRLRGKHKAIYTPHVDTGDYVVVVNADQLKVTGNKAKDKKYYRHSGYPGGLYETNFEKLQEKAPGRALELAVKGMLPKGPLGYAMIKKLKVYAGADHPHTAQQPEALEI